MTTPSTDSSAHRPGCHGASSADEAVTSRPSAAATERTASTASAHETGRASPHQPPATASPDGDHGQVQRLRGQGGVECRELLVGRAAVDGQDRRRAGVARQRDRAGLEDRHVGVAVADVLAGGPQHPREQRRGHEAGLGAQRVGQLEQVASRVVGGQAEGVEVGRPDEREVHHLDEALAGQRAADPAAQLLGPGQPATRRRRRQHRRHLVVADEPDDLLGEVLRVGQVGAPRRRRDGERPRPRRPRTRRRAGTRCCAPR